MLQDQSRNRTPMPDAQPTASAAQTKPRRARAEAGIARMLSGPALPSPGSPEAMAAWRAACTEFDRRTRLGDDEARRLRIGETMALWTPDKVRSAINRDFSSATSGNEAVAMAAMSRAELQELLVLTLQRDIRFEEAARDTRIHECFARAYPDEADPVPDTDGVGDHTLAAITTHKAAYAAWLPHLKATSEAIPGTEHDRECEAAAEAPRSHEDAAYETLIGTPPTTFVGLVALADYLPGAVLRNAKADEDDDGLRALATICSAIKDLAGRDAELIALGRQFDRLHAEWLAAEEANREPASRCAAAIKKAEHLEGDDYRAAARLAWHLPGVDEAHRAKEDAFEAIEPVAEAMLALPARTPAGFAAKARVLIWGVWAGGQYGQTAEEDLSGDYSRRCVRLFVESTCAAAGVDWRGELVPGAASAAATGGLVDEILRVWRDWSIISDTHRNEEEEHAAMTALIERRDALMAAADALPASHENLLPKALILAWMDYVELWRNGQSRDAYGIDGRLAVDIDTAICGRLATGA